MSATFFRYFIGFRPNPALRAWLTSISGFAGQFDKRIRPAHLHLTLCVIAECAQRDRFIASRVDAAFAGRMLSSCLIRLGRVRGGPGGAALHSLGGRAEIEQLYRLILACLAERGLFPLHRRSGLRPHVTLGYDPCRFAPFNLPCEWVPDEILLIESEVGEGIHNVFGRWPLLPPPQGSLPYDAPSTPFATLSNHGHALASAA